MTVRQRSSYDRDNLPAPTGGRTTARRIVTVRTVSPHHAVWRRSPRASGASGVAASHDTGRDLWPWMVAIAVNLLGLVIGAVVVMQAI